MWFLFCIVIISVFFFFFFQAEDGIRDRNVTGVQTCALPISGEADRADQRWKSDALQYQRHENYAEREKDDQVPLREWAAIGQHCRKRESGGRSEERRVGKECRCGEGAQG